jgi:phage gpG-like protein
MPSRPQLSLDIHSQGDEQAAQLLLKLGKRGEDPRPAFRQIIEDLRIAEDHWFGSHGAGTWAPLADSTREQKQRLGQPLSPLVATGELRRSLEVKRGRGATRSATKTRMRFGTKLWYAKFHKLGSGYTPVRDPLIVVDANARRRMVRDVRDYMLGRTKGLSSGGDSP